MQLNHYLSRNARYFCSEPAVYFNEEVLTYGQLDRRSSQLANALLALGLKKGDRVAVQAWNSPRVVEFECALYKVGLVRVPINARQTVKETLELLIDADACALLAGGSHADDLINANADLSALKVKACFDGERSGWLDYETLIAKASDRAPECVLADDDIAVLHYSSGSTGKLKAAVQTFGNRKAGLRNVVMGAPGIAGPGDTVLMMGPLTHATGVLMQPIMSRGAALRVYDKFDLDRMFDDANKKAFTHAFMVPTMLNMMMAHPNVTRVDFSSVKQLSYGAAPSSPDRIREIWERVGPVLVQGYGTSEVCGGVSALTTQDHHRAMKDRPELLGSCGRAMTETEMSVMNENGEELPVGEVGEIWIRGDSVAKGYWKAPEQTAESFRNDGWYRTGDLARTDDEGYLFIVGRSKDMIISGGFNIYTSEVESVMQAHPAVQEVCVFGIPDATWGEAVHACVTLKRGHVLNESQLLASLGVGLASYKKPRSLSILDNLPRNNNGKIDRKVMRAPYWTSRSNSVI